MKRFLFYTIFTTLLLGVKAQTVLNVATQRFEEKMDYQPGQVLLLNLEKAQVSIQGWNQDYYAFEILLKSKHKDRQQAVKELEYLKYQLKKEGDTLRFSNDFVSGQSFRKVQGILNIELLVKAPRSSKVAVSNAYGATTVSNMSDRVSLEGKFVDSDVSNCDGDLSLIAVFGSNRISDHAGDLYMDLSRVDLIGNQIKGKVTGKANYGTIQLMGLSSAEVDIEARRTSFTLELIAPIDSYHYDLSTDLGTIFLEGSMNLKKSSKWEYEGTSNSKITIMTSFSPITIRDNTLNAYKQ
ncbi:MAG: hypothetical protein R8G66_30155 [Cytophagales bacterium]|nr:hypothetical protein [Cytophagales bacterium]